jgi:hypothetical protein
MPQRQASGGNDGDDDSNDDDGEFHTKTLKREHQRQSKQTFSNLKHILGQVGVQHHHRNGSDNQSTEWRKNLRAPRVCAWEMEPNCVI